MLRQEPGKKARPNTRKVRVGSVDIGGGSPVSIQTMWKSPLGSADSDLIRQIEGLASLGCEIMRFAVPNTEAADILGELAGSLKIPLVADIHFDYRIALRCLDWPVAKVRINPGNIGAGWKVEEVVRKAMDKGAALRVGINGGSLPRNLRDEPDMGEAMVKAAEDELDILEKLGFEDVIFSLKSSDMESTLHANRLFAQRHRYPLHLGLTESGPLIPGLVRSTLVLAQLLREGIGDTRLPRLHG